MQKMALEWHCRTMFSGPAKTGDAEIRTGSDGFACYSEKYMILTKVLFVKKGRKEVVPRKTAF